VKACRALSSTPPPRRSAPGSRPTTAFAALKHAFKKVGDHWEPKGHKGPSDARAKASSTKEQLYRRAQKLHIPGRSRMDKKELARAIARRQ
jgi:hypothetical protein